MKINKITILAVILLSSYFVHAQTIPVAVSDGLNTALTYANTGAANVLELTDSGGQYYCTATTIVSPITIRAQAGLAVKPTIIIKGCKALPFLKIYDSFTLDGVILDGYDPVAATYDSVQHVFAIAVLAGSTNEKPDFALKNCVVQNIYKFGDPATSKDGDIFDVSTGARAGVLLFENTIFTHTGDEAIRAINTHKAPVAVEGNFCTTMTVRNCTFHDIRGSSIKIEGDGDSTNVDSQVLIDHCTFNKSQVRVIWHRDLQNTVIRNLLVTNLMQGNDQMDNCISIQGNGTTVSYVDTFNVTVPNHTSGFLADAGSWSGAKRTGTFDAATIYNLDPMYADAANGDFTLAANSPVRTMGSDGKALGDVRWAGQPTAVKDLNTVPTTFSLEQNYPNPFNPTTLLNSQFQVLENIR